LRLLLPMLLLLQLLAQLLWLSLGWLLLLVLLLLLWRLSPTLPQVIQQQSCCPRLGCCRQGDAATLGSQKAAPATSRACCCRRCC
jgi:hypothetical protein